LAEPGTILQLSVPAIGLFGLAEPFLQLADKVLKALFGQVIDGSHSQSSGCGKLSFELPAFSFVHIALSRHFWQNGEDVEWLQPQSDSGSQRRTLRSSGAGRLWGVECHTRHAGEEALDAIRRCGSSKRSDAMLFADVILRQRSISFGLARSNSRFVTQQGGTPRLPCARKGAYGAGPVFRSALDNMSND
jgi:hypothetical protein